MPIRIASTRNRMMTSCGSRPSVLSTATSVVRRLTMTSIVFTMPIPPISSDTRPMTTTRSPIALDTCSFISFSSVVVVMSVL